MQEPGRQYSPSTGSVYYRYGFNGKENDNEVKGEGNQQDYGMRIYDPRLGRFLSVDPVTKQYPELTPYQFASNRPIDGVDLDGLEWGPVGALRMLANYNTHESNNNNNKSNSINVVLDPGHGGDDPGVSKVNGKRNEADITLLTIRDIRERLNRDNPRLNVNLTRDVDINPGGKGQKASLKSRVKYANDYKANYFVSVHVNSANNGAKVNTSADYVVIP